MSVDDRLLLSPASEEAGTLQSLPPLELGARRRCKPSRLVAVVVLVCSVAGAVYWLGFRHTHGHGANTTVTPMCPFDEQADYDIIMVGLGTAGSVVLPRIIQDPKLSHLRVLVLEAGAPTQWGLGGREDTPAFPHASQANLTGFDVPGETPTVAWTPSAGPYKLKETPFTFQGMGYGGCSVYSGNMMQQPPSYDFDYNWPEGWHSDDLRPYFVRAFNTVPVTNTSSTDGQHYCTGAASVMGEMYERAGIKKVDTADLADQPDKYYSWPFVAASGGQRAGVIDYLRPLVNRSTGCSTLHRLTILPLAKALQILWVDDTDGAAGGVTASGVRFHLRSVLADEVAGVAGVEHVGRLRKGGRLILAAGALQSPRLLLLSGVGPRGKESEIFEGPRATSQFTTDNQRIGTVFDHVSSSISIEITGGPHKEAGKQYWFNDFKSNIADVNRYLRDRSGPYAQFGPVSMMHMVNPSNATYSGGGNSTAGLGSWPILPLCVASRASCNPSCDIEPSPTCQPCCFGFCAREFNHTTGIRSNKSFCLDYPGIEVFVNPYGFGTAATQNKNGSYFSLYVVIHRPFSRALLHMTEDAWLQWPPIYLEGQGQYAKAGERDLENMALAMHYILQLVVANKHLKVVFGPGGETHPNLNPLNISDVKKYVAGWNPVQGVYYTRQIVNHWGGTIPLVNQRDPPSGGVGGADTEALIVVGTSNVHVVDSSLIPAPLSAHPIFTLLAVAEKAGDILASQLRASSSNS